MLALPTVTKDALDSGRIASRGMLRFDLGSGSYGFWEGDAPFTYGGVVYVGAGSLIEVDAFQQGSDLTPSEIVVRLTSTNGLTPDTLATIESEVYHQRPFAIFQAYFDIDTLALLSVETVARGYIDQLVHSDTVDGRSMIEARLESRYRDHLKSGYRVRSDTDQQTLYPGDTGLRHVTTVATENILFGRATQTNVPAKKSKSWLQKLFG